MTPINFTSFLFSLVIVDVHYTFMRLRYHAEAPGLLPSWLHRLLFCLQRYRDAHARGVDGAAQTRDGSDGWHYHSDQRRLMEMEAEDAFKIQSTVLVVLGLAIMGAAVAAFYLTIRLCRYWLW